MKKNGKKLVMFLYVIIVVLLILEVRHFIKLREQVPSSHYNEKIEVLKSEFEIIKSYNDKIPKTHEIYSEFEYCIKRGNLQEIIDFFKKYENINYRVIDALYKKNTGCDVSESNEYYQKYHLKTIYENNNEKHIFFLKEDLFFNQNIEILVSIKLDRFIKQLTNFRKSLELIAGDINE